MENTETKTPKVQIQVDDVEIRHHDNFQLANLRLPYRLTTADVMKRKKKKKTLPLVLDGDKVWPNILFICVYQRAKMEESL